MLKKAPLISKWLLLLGCFLASLSYAQGQAIQINTRFDSWVGKPTWVLMIRDLDHNINIPYVFQISHSDSYWVALTFGRNYLISASTLQILLYIPRWNQYRNYRVDNFCNLESNGRINRGESMFITVSGNLTPNPNTYTCNVTKFPSGDLTIVNP